MTDRKFNFALGLAAFHLVMVAAGLWGSNLFVKTPLASYYEVYGKLTGALAQIKFFAPGLKSQIRVVAEGTMPSGEKFSTTLLQGNREVDLRTYNILAAFWAPSISDKADVQRSIVASWAGKLFGQMPALEAVEIRVEAVELPSMELARHGAKIFWHEIYRASYLKKERHLELVNEKS